ncbi:EAL domain-containing protein [Limisalsivibrio acetivorans]|uniref:EAL domain-containing protein n=1 Tax=Limisalsivibrio acetivorans TaxID=1304888 RepID=UPI0003B62C7D|nr:EAL domain-containing protein [Limisalsivibrio acetivorans]
MKGRSYRLSLYLGGFMLAFSIFLSVVIILWSSADSSVAVRQELLKILQRNHGIIKIILKEEIESTSKILKDIRFSLRDVLELQEMSDTSELKRKLVDFYDSALGDSADILIYSSVDGKTIIDASSPFFDTSPVVRYVAQGNVSEDGESTIHAAPLTDREGYLHVILGGIQSVEEESGRVLGHIYTGRILNGNSGLLINAAQDAGIDASAFVWQGQMVASHSSIENPARAVEVCRNGGIEDLEGSVIGYCQRLSINGSEAPLFVYQELPDSSLSYLRKGILKRAFTIVLIIVCMTLITVYIFQRVMKRSVNSLVDYAHEVSNLRYLKPFEPTAIKEFNTVAAALEELNHNLRETEAYLGNFMNFAKAPLIAWDADNNIVLYNKSMEALTGIQTEDAMGRGIEVIFPCLTGEKLKELLANSVRNTEPLSNFESIVKNIGTGELRYILWSLSNVKDEEKVYGVVLQGIDITDRKSSEEKLLLASKVFENTIEAIYITNTKGIVLSINSAFTSITGYSEEEALGSRTSILKSGRHTSSFYREMWEKLRRDGKWQGEIWNRRKNGELYPALLNISSITDGDGRVTHYIGVMHDITERKKYEEQIKYQAHYDPLTSLPNRYLFHDRLGMAIGRAKRNGTFIGLLTLDMDRFKNVNDTLGHNIGDILLQKIGERILNTVGESMTVSRLGGDEYTVIIEDITDKGRAVTISHNIMRQLEKPFHVDEYELFLKSSAGLSFYPEDGEDIFILVKNADAAMYRAKSKGRGMLQVYTTDFNDKAKEHLMIETKLNRALDHDEFRIHYQPKINLKTMELVGMEALIRWENPELGKVYPDQFIPIAEETGLIIPIGHWVLKKACEDLKRWHSMGFTGLNLAVNLSMKQFNQKDLYSSVKDVVDDIGIDPSMLEMEITESMIMEDPARTREILDKLHSVGLTFAIDDFGTGFSSIGYLTEIPIDTLKIDKSFIMNIENDEDSRAIVRTVVQLAHNLNISVVAEGVESAEHVRLLNEMECELAQGYFFSRPVPADEFEEFLSEWEKQVKVKVSTPD